MDWRSKISTELSRIQPGQNPGRTRTTARRIAGIALEELYSLPGNDVIALLQKASHDTSLPPVVQESARRLSARLSPQFTSQSIDPIGDCKIIVDFVKEKIQ